ncbi:MAG: cyclic nucleotide-binding domain-containing protein [SAR324 cluster bacterium]|nr:cyclic nucleotide-binding domain-containing protein [SAR324 cluster bacterium]
MNLPNQNLLEENQRIIEHLRKSRLFEHLQESVLQKLLSLSEIEKVTPGSKILIEGEANSKIYFLIEGKVVVYCGEEQILNLKRCGDIFGEISAISSNPCSASVVADSGVELFAISASHIRDHSDGQEKNPLRDILYRLFALILVDKLDLTTRKAKQYEATNKQLHSAQIELQNAHDELEKRNFELQEEVSSHEHSEVALTQINAELEKKSEELQQALEIQQMMNDNLLDTTMQLNETKAQLIQSQKLEAIGTLAGGVAHEFNNLLSPILGYTQMLMIGKTSEDDAEALEQIYQAGSRAKELVEQVLMFSRKTLPKKELIHLTSVVTKSVEFLQQTLPSSILLTHESADDIPDILADPFQIHQILVNLCINSSHAMPEGGEIKVSLAHDEFCEIATEDAKIQGDFVILAVRDTGQGMDDKTVGRIFDPFFTTKEVGKGTGLGLSVVHGIVQDHDAHIIVNSRLGEGTKFTIYFPAQSEPENGEGKD